MAQPNLGVPTQAGFLTLHWDGDVILFVTDDAGNVVDFRIGLDGDITPRDPNFTGLTVYDRDAAGVIVQSSNATGSTGFNPLDPSTTSGPGATGSAGFKAPNVLAQYTRSDGFAVANGIQINGVRAFDSNLGAWMTPDAFEGDIHDPASQQKYMWNRGNPVDYSDPSGYVIIAHDNGLLGAKIREAIWKILNWPVPDSWPRPPGFGCTCSSSGGYGLDSGESSKRSGADLSKSDAPASSSASADRLSTQLRRAAQDSERGTPIAGAGTNKVLHDRARLVAQFGGKASDWAKMVSSSYKNLQTGVTVERHWYQNMVTGERVNIKDKFQ